MASENSANVTNVYIHMALCVFRFLHIAFAYTMCPVFTDN